MTSTALVRRAAKYDALALKVRPYSVGAKKKKFRSYSSSFYNSARRLSNRRREPVRLMNGMAYRRTLHRKNVAVLSATKTSWKIGNKEAIKKGLRYQARAGRHFFIFSPKAELLAANVLTAGMAVGAVLGTYAAASKIQEKIIEARLGRKVPKKNVRASQVIAAHKRNLQAKRKRRPPNLTPQQRREIARRRRRNSRGQFA